MEEEATKKIVDLNSKMPITLGDSLLKVSEKKKEVAEYKNDRGTLIQDVKDMQNQQKQIDNILNKIYKSLNAIGVEISKESKTTTTTSETKVIKTIEEPKFTFTYGEKNGNKFNNYSYNINCKLITNIIRRIRCI